MMFHSIVYILHYNVYNLEYLQKGTARVEANANY